NVYMPVLSYWAWFQALDITNPMTATDVKGQSMLVEGSTDGGATWTTLDTVDSIEPTWQPRQIAALDQLIDLTAGPLLIRFTVHNDAAMTVVEAGVDDVQVSTLTQACNPDQGAPVVPSSSGGCDLAPRAPATPVTLLLLVAAALLLRRRFGV